ncbi:hypothetical protein J6590_093686 [Homalodisca vitripennis]|nr:hypothetical protein J6590_093686 [Homalodisca vitripennis]
MECITADTWTYINCTEQKRKRRRVDVDGEKSFPWQTSLRKYSKLKKNQKSQEESFNKKIELLNEKLDTNRRLLNGILEITGGLLKLNDKLGKREDVLSAVKEVGKALGMDVVDSMFDAYHRMGDRAAHNSIYVNEDLTPARRRLLGMGRQLKSDNDDRHQLPLSWREFSDSELFSYVAHTRSTFLSSFWMNSSFAACLTNCTIVPDGLPQFSLFPTLCQASTIESEMFKSSAFLPLSLHLLYPHFFHSDTIHSECDDM